MFGLVGNVVRRRLGSLRSISSLRVTEVFSSVQGEGPFVGRPSVFLRLGMCNLECVWCDTKFTWLFDEGQLKRMQEAVPEELKSSVGTVVYDKKQEMEKITVQHVLEKVVEAASDNKKVKAVVITGGEPLLHKKALMELCPALIEEGFRIEVETNGTLSPHGLPSAVHYNVSAKLANSYQPQSKRIKPSILKEFYSLHSVLKFVVAREEDLEEIAEIVEQTGFPPERVFIMPEGTDPSTLAERGKWLVEKCLSNGYQYGHRIHVSLWGDKRGV